MQLAARLCIAVIAVLTTVPAEASPRKIVACTGPADPAPCLVEGAEPDHSRLPATGPTAWISGNRLVISWVGEADEVRIAGQISIRDPIPRVAPRLYQQIVQYPKAQQTRVQLSFSVKRGDDIQYISHEDGLVGPMAFPVLSGGDLDPPTIVFGKDLPKARVWLPPGYRTGVRYPILYLADGGMTSPGAWLTEPIRRGELAPLIVVGVDEAPEGRDGSEIRIATYVGASSGPLSPEFVAHERFLLDSVIPVIERQYGAPPERRLRAIGGASAGGVWTASMALRNPGVFGTAFVMSPGKPPAQHGLARSSTRFYVSAGDLEPGFRWAAECLAGNIVARGGVATFTSYPAGHDPWMWGRILLDNARDWLNPRAPRPVLAALPSAECKDRFR